MGRVFGWLLDYFMGSVTLPWLLPAVGAIAVGIWGLLQAWGPWIVVMALSTAAAIMVIINQIKQSRQLTVSANGGKNKTVEIPEDTADKIHRWIDRAGYGVRRDKSNPNYLFQFLIRNPVLGNSAGEIVIIMPKDLPIITMSLAAALLGESLNNFKSFDAKRRNEFLCDFGIEMLRLGMSSSGSLPNPIILSHSFHYEVTMTEGQFMEKLVFMQRGYGLFTSVCQKYLYKI